MNSPTKNSPKRVLKIALGDCAEQKLTKCQVLREVEPPFAEQIQGYESPTKNSPKRVLKIALGGIRTPDLLVRSQTLYPTGLQAQNTYSILFSVFPRPTGEG